LNAVHLGTLAPGSRFRTESGREGVLLYANELRARVRFGSATTKTITRGVGSKARTFDVTTPAEEVDIGPRTEVVALPNAE
jgi:hypothetical protein